MKIVIEIPEEFEEHFHRDNFEDSLKRIETDIRLQMVDNTNTFSGLYEIELTKMLRKAFKENTPV